MDSALVLWIVGGVLLFILWPVFVWPLIEIIVNIAVMFLAAIAAVVAAIVISLIPLFRNIRAFFKHGKQVFMAAYNQERDKTRYGAVKEKKKAIAPTKFDRRNFTKDVDITDVKEKDIK